MSITNDLIKEVPDIKAEEYSEFGKPYAAFPVQTDPVQTCLAGSLWHGGELANLGMCPAYMAQRCGSKWDPYCDEYLLGLEDIDLIRDVLQQTAVKKYCRLADNSSCSINCQPFNPISNASTQICGFYGNEGLIDGNQNIDIGYYTPVNISPVYMNRCAISCDQIDNMTDDDPVVNNCLSSGLCGSQMNNICQLASQNGKPLGNKALQAYCELQTSLGKIPASPPQPSVKSPLMSLERSVTNGGTISKLMWIFIILALIVAIIYVYKSPHHKK